MSAFLGYLFHLDEHLLALITLHSAWVYVLLFCMMFIEMGIVFAAFLPGDSLLFASGALAASSGSDLNIHLLFILLVTASVAGSSMNYFIGKWLGPKIFHSEKSWILNPKHLQRAHSYYERYGGKTIILARFIPVIRVIAPFIAGIGYMTYRQFLIFNFIGATLWLAIILYGSFLFGNIPLVKQHFSLVLVAVILLSLTPIIIERSRYFLYDRVTK